jgi:hypothetical protein
MKPLSVIIALSVVTMLSFSAIAHDGHHPDAPNPSPNASVSQEIGYEVVTITHGSPGVKGREGKIWGELVPFNEGKPRPWLAGANGTSVITFKEDVKINGESLAKGSYGLMMIPAKDSWTIVFSSNSTKFGIMNYKPEEDVLRLTVKPTRAPLQEWLKYSIEKTGDVTAEISMRWENLKVGFSVEAPDKREGH